MTNILIGLGVFSAFLLMMGATYEIVSAQIDKRRYKTPPGHLVDVGGHKLHMLTMGTRQTDQQPVIIMEAGVASNSLDWQLVQPQVAEFAQVVSYDRANCGWSETSTTTRSPQQIVEELHALLNNAAIESPYVLVGHSFGGIYVRLYAEMYPDEVAGLVLVESSVPSMIKTINTEPEIRRLKRVARLKKIGLVRAMLPRILSHVRYLEGAAKKQYLAFNMLDSDTVIREAVPMYKGITLSDTLNLPVTVISREPFADLSSEQLWQDYQAELAGLSPDTRHIFANTGSHYPALAEPELITKVIREMLGRVQSQL